MVEIVVYRFQLVQDLFLVFVVGVIWEKRALNNKYCRNCFGDNDTDIRASEWSVFLFRQGILTDEHGQDVSLVNHTF